MAEIPLDINSDDESEILYKQLEQAQQENPELYEKARIIGSRNTLYAAFMMRNEMGPSYEAIKALVSWDDIHAFAEKYNITERELELSDALILNAYKALKKNPGLGTNIILSKND
jgi:hypothetical protein